MSWPFPSSQQVPGQGPTLIPNFNPVLVGARDLGNVSPVDFLAANPRALSQTTLTLGGSVTSGNTITITFSNAVLSAAVSVAVTAGASDTLTTLAEKIAAGFNDSVVFQGVGAYADAAGAVVTLKWPGPVGNFSTLSVALSTGATETVVIGTGAIAVVAASATATIGGTITAGNTITLTLTNAGVSGFPHGVTYTVVTGDTASTIATALAAAINADATFKTANVSASASGAVVTVIEQGSIGNSTVLSDTLSAGATETVTLTPANGDLSGGAGVVGTAPSGGGGPIIPRANFTFVSGSTHSDYLLGIPVILDNWTVSRMVKQGMPIA